MRRLLTPLAALLLLLFGVACSDDDVVQGPSEDATDDDGGGGDASIESSVTVELLDPGQEPRQVLRLKPPADCEQRVTQRQVVTQ
jgi:hypothetical protein